MYTNYKCSCFSRALLKASTSLAISWIVSFYILSLPSFTIAYTSLPYIMAGLVTDLKTFPSVLFFILLLHKTNYTPFRFMYVAWILWLTSLSVRLVRVMNELKYFKLLHSLQPLSSSPESLSVVFSLWIWWKMKHNQG